MGEQKLRRWGQVGLVAVAGLLTVMNVAALGFRQRGHKEISLLLDRYEQTGQSDGEDKSKNGENQDKQKTLWEEQAERINKRSIFSKKKAKDFSGKLVGVLGEQAFFEGENKGYKVGQSVKGAKLKQIGPDWVQMEFKGKPKKLFVFSTDKGGAAPSGPSAAGPGRPGRERGPRMGPGENVDVTPEMIEQFKSMPAEMRAKALEHMPAEMRKKLEEEL